MTGITGKWWSRGGARIVFDEEDVERLVGRLSVIGSNHVEYQGLDAGMRA